MKINKILVALLVVVVCSSLALSAAPKKAAKKASFLYFHKGDKFLTPQIGINSTTIPFGANFEYGLTENIGLGATLMVWLWSDFGYSASIINPSVEATYHFTKLNVEKLDLFAGAGLGYSIFSSDYGFGASGISLYPFAAGRYWLSKKLAVSLKLNFDLIGDWTGIGALLGVTLPL
ncbi:MAG TPA: hypothetical protein PK919_04680 [Candidatus Aminicenantes bacterium]|nr:hypothetical protein [Candidatus Aminicenantes bacterium]